MSWKSVNDVLDCLQIQTKLAAEEPLQILLGSWSEIVGEAIAAHTQPISIQRGVLRVATPSAAWAQNLTFERQQLLVKINSVLTASVRDVRFATAGWQRPQISQTRELNDSPRDHPTYIGIVDIANSDRQGKITVNDAFANWREKIRQRSQNLPLCPQCQCPTPPGEIERWQVCSLCVAKKFQE
ncbi:Zn-ribbon-containing, possibly RNA-binding protein and truncated derivatives [Richelia intracellularis]|nr:Zn-ribbon-containing, possibly RNA-binding protein and truncated derivatives [Richelia intracellularis]